MLAEECEALTVMTVQPGYFKKDFASFAPMQ